MLSQKLARHKPRATDKVTKISTVSGSSSGTGGPKSPAIRSPRIRTPTIRSAAEKFTRAMDAAQPNVQRAPEAVMDVEMAPAREPIASQAPPPVGATSDQAENNSDNSNNNSANTGSSAAQVHDQSQLVPPLELLSVQTPAGSTPTSPGGISNSSMENATPTTDESETVSTWVGSLDQGKISLRQLLVNYRTRAAGETKTKPAEVMQREKAVKSFLRKLLYDFEVYPGVADNHHFDRILAFPTGPPYNTCVPAEVAQLMAAVLDKFNSENWGRTDTPETGDEDVFADEDGSAAPASATTSAAPSLPGILGMGTIRLPPRNHRIWGERGIMHGLALSRKAGSTRTVYTLNPRYLHQKRTAKIHGHNGIAVGTWWPFQKLAHFHGAHGAPVRGITGSKDYGAYSIVVSGTSTYHDADMDVDEGTRLYYSADSSTDNEDRHRVAERSNATKSLEMSMQNHKPVRVLRSSGKGVYAPVVGIRYDGLYAVTDMKVKTNLRGGKYEQFVLERLPGQMEFGRVYMTWPTREQQADYEKIRQRY
ncbi:PUA-like domain-containing protein [Cercophora scortea]|uniref:PUA-like domain-containing protein n=1 Tax=Cercophora scortea TaxID=314031 RepID=A0AAE0M3K5_9PEZI|nr:PUA-like domain-containing protein [Cercophora scortea]